MEWFRSNEITIEYLHFYIIGALYQEKYFAVQSHPLRYLLITYIFHFSLIAAILDI